MAEQNKKKAKKGGSYCVAGAPNDVSCKNNTYTAGVSMHYFPKNENMKIIVLLVNYFERSLNGEAGLF